MYSLSNNMARPYTINIKVGTDPNNEAPLVKKHRVLPGAAGELLIEDAEAAEIKKLDGPVAAMLKDKNLELKKITAKAKAKGKDEDSDDIAS